MKTLLLLSLLVCSLTFNLRSTKQYYDAYVMAVQWPNGYCSGANCKGKDANVPKNIMTIHGLWPGLINGNMLKDCTSGVKIVDDGSSLFQNMRTYWPSFSKSNVDFWTHEYNKHGYCMVEEYGWSGYKNYFQFVLDLHSRTYRDLFRNAFAGYSGTTVISYDTLKSKIQSVIPGATINMRCTGGYISELYFYLNKNYSPSPNTKFSNNCKSGKLVMK